MKSRFRTTQLLLAGMMLMMALALVEALREIDLSEIRFVFLAAR